MPAASSAGSSTRCASLVLSVFDRYPVPAALGEHAWSEARASWQRRLQLIGLHPPKRAFEIPDPFVKAYLDLMPIHKKLRASELPTLQGYLKVTLCNMHEELTKRMDVPAVVASLLEGTAGARDASALTRKRRRRWPRQAAPRRSWLSTRWPSIPRRPDWTRARRASSRSRWCRSPAGNSKQPAAYRRLVRPDVAIPRVRPASTASMPRPVDAPGLCRGFGASLRRASAIAC